MAGPLSHLSPPLGVQRFQLFPARSRLGIVDLVDTSRGADREVKKPGYIFCEEHCAARKCACAHYGGGTCRFSYTYTGLLRSAEKDAFAFVRPGAASEPAALRFAAAMATPPERQPCGRPPPPRPTPSFYMYDGM